MPLVNVYHKGRLCERFGTLGRLLQESVADALTCSDDRGGQLEPDDVNVIFTPFGLFDQVGKVDLMIVISAPFFPERNKILETRRGLIIGRLGSCREIAGCTCSVRVQLLPSSSETFIAGTVSKPPALAINCLRT